ncbi:hypothetical protein EV130_104578 [Rhizobium azibense]|uniref:Uncharacterized protein n=1 Tax=Rhizobium azibense TaxID=1136135 RepID=A0A4R3QWV6_9HYPH|nr:hypothetical protein EV130_104578 [Rhizobium azibense]
MPPDLANAIDAEVRLEYAAHLDLHRHVVASASRHAIHVHAFGEGLVIGGRGNRQQFADRLDPEHRTVFIDEGDHRFSGRRAPPGRNMQTLCAVSRWSDKARSSPAQEPSSSRSLRLGAQAGNHRPLRPSSPIH